MPESAIEASLSLIDWSGRAILAAILFCLAAGVAANWALARRYGSMEKEIRSRQADCGPWTHPLLGLIAREHAAAVQQAGVAINVQAIIENGFASQLRGLLLAERFLRSSTGLTIILGLIGTFYGLTSAIGRLVRLVTTESTQAAEIGQTLTTGLSQALSGMAVAFTTSLFGILAAIVLMLIAIVSNVTDRRTAIMVQLENYLEAQARNQLGQLPSAGQVPNLERAIQAFGQAVARLQEGTDRFDASLQNFATSTRDFREFNMHLKDNVQRMSLCFADFSEALKSQVSELKPSRRA